MDNNSKKNPIDIVIIFVQAPPEQESFGNESDYTSIAKSRAVTNAYRTNYDNIFGGKTTRGQS